MKEEILAIILIKVYVVDSKSVIAILKVYFHFVLSQFFSQMPAWISVLKELVKDEHKAQSEKSWVYKARGI